MAWFHYLEKAGVRHAVRACWNVTDPANGLWSNCWNGLNGLFMKDNRTPQALYWVFERYAQMLGRTLATTSTTPGDVVALARNTSSDAAAAGTTKVLIGRFVSDTTQASAAAKSIAVHLQGLPAATTRARIEIQRIPYLRPDVQSGPDTTAQPLQNVEVVDRYTAKVVGGKVSAYLPAFKDRDAYYLSVD
ncbi:MAG: hypothetical protein H7Z19_15845 [Chitinophagaceae bacterium]|nr:hypothetical protein [Rubrivivax sp.]